MEPSISPESPNTQSFPRFLPPPFSGEPAVSKTLQKRTACPQKSQVGKLDGGWTNTFEKKLVKLGIFPK